MHRFEHINFGAKQRGAALGVGLILLLAMTLSGVFILNSSIMDERMSANHRSQTNAFLAAEAGLLKSQRFLDDNWNDRDWSASSCVPGESASLFNDVSYANDASFNVVGFDCSPQLGVTLRSEGFIDNLGVSRVLTARYEPPMPDGPGPGDAPAAIGCLGGRCAISAGTGGHSKIDGRDHTPPGDCSGNSCRMEPTGGDAKPSIFLTDAASNIAGGNNAGSFCGLKVDGSATGCGQNNSTDQFWYPDLYPDDADGNSTVPTAEAFIDDSAMGQITAESVSDPTVLGSLDFPKVTYFDSNNSTPENRKVAGNNNHAGILIIDGVEFGGGGTGTFEGLIIIRGCGSVNLGGTFNIYGAILVDVRGCDDDYSPFTGNGTPSVRFSSEALAGASGLIPGGAGGLQNWAEEIQGL